MEKGLLILAYLMAYFILLKKTKKSVHMLQQNLYNENNRYGKWIWSNKAISFGTYSFFAFVFVFMSYFSTSDEVLWFFLAATSIAYVATYFQLKQRAKVEQHKKPLVITARIKRQLFTIAIIYLLPAVIAILMPSLKFTMLLLLTLLVYLNFVVVYIANLINQPVEKMVYLYYKNKAKAKLKAMPNLKIIGITGSYGKTSSKNILNDVLSIKYNTLATPKSINTLNGNLITINNKLSKFDEVFIVEMGAYVKGDIADLCKLVGPKYGIITTIGTAHLATFGSEENILKGKMELLESLPDDGVCILNADDPKQKTYKQNNNCKIVWIGIDEKADVNASNIKCSHKGTSFDVSFKGDKKKYSFETKLLGRHNVYNILAAIALGKEFGINADKLIQGVAKVGAIEHRLEIKKLGNFYQIDDAYNSNPVGAKGALDVLGMMPGKKVVVTPGMVELGDEEARYNKEFGRQIADVADEVILIGKKRTVPIYEGLIEKKFKKDNIHILNDVKAAYPLIAKMKDKQELYALFENDLPDTYTEGGK